MGDPRKFRGKYSGPGHPWQRARMEVEAVLKREYGLKNKTELWKITSKLKSFADQAKKLIAERGTQAELESKQLIKKIARIGLLPESAKLDDVLGLNIKNLLERRLQTLVLRKGMARTSTQARQFIVHEHVKIGDKKINAPGYIVLMEEESQIAFVQKSSLASAEHPERSIKQKPSSSIAREAKAPAKRHARAYSNKPKPAAKAEAPSKEATTKAGSSSKNSEAAK